jgi:surface protein
MASLFQSAKFNRDIGAWNVASVTSMSGVFSAAAAFNQNIAGWNVLRTTTFQSTFNAPSGLSTCNQRAIYLGWGATLRAAYPAWPACTVGALCTTCITDANIATAVTAWVTSPTTATATYGPIGEWDVSAVSCMVALFYNQPTFNSDISKWNVASVTTMSVHS